MKASKEYRTRHPESVEGSPTLLSKGQIPRFALNDGRKPLEAFINQNLAKRLTILSIFILLISSLSMAQPNPKTLDHYEELSGTYIYDILPDRQGNIWLGTMGGLVKFDGYEFKRFHPDPRDSTTIGDLLTYTLFEEENGTIWIGSNGSIYKYNPDTRLFNQFLTTPILEYPDYGQVWTVGITADGKGRVYFAILSGMGLRELPGLLYYNEEEDQMNRLFGDDSLEVQNVYNITTVSDGTISLGANNGVFNIDLDQNLIQVHDTILAKAGFRENEFVEELIGDNTGSIWAPTNQSRLMQFSIANMEFKLWDFRDLSDELFTGNRFFRSDLDSDGRLWIPGDKGIIVFDPAEELFAQFGQEMLNARQASKFSVIEFDSFGNLWIGTETAGLFKFPNRNILDSYVHNPDDPNSISEGWVSRMFEGEDGLIWVPTMDQTGNEGINTIDPTTGTLTKQLYNEILPDHRGVYMVNKVRPGEILFRSHRGLDIYNTETGNITESGFEEVEDQVNYVNDVILDSRDNIWLATMNGLFRNKNGSVERIDLGALELSTQTANEVTRIFESSNKETPGWWIQTNDGLYYMDSQTEKIDRRGFESSRGDIFSSQDINAVFEDWNGIVWVGTWQGGLNRYNPETGEVKVYTIDDGLPSMSIQGILGDEENNALWMSTFSGMSRFSLENEQFNNFGLDDGAQGLLYADGSLLETSEGYFAFGGSNGINVFNPNEITENSLPPIVQITDFKIGNDSLNFDQLPRDGNGNILLTYDQNNISIDYSGIHYDNPDKNRFSFWIENYDTEWRNVGTIRSAYYYNIPPGYYTFQIKASNTNGVWSEPVSLAFFVAPPWWMTWWAYGLYVLIFGLGVFTVHTVQKRRVVRKERERIKDRELEQAKEVEKAYTELKATQQQLVHSEKMASLGELTAGIAHEIQNPLNFVNNFSDVNKELAEELMGEIEKGNEQDAKAILKDIIDNEEKILHHGQRADGIVKGMLQHSRGGQGEKELTDINELADEYLRLAYHGLRAKDKSFNADFKTELDPDLPKVNVVPQDIGRVLLNLINNAFHAVSAEASAKVDGALEARNENTESDPSRPDDPVGRASASGSTNKYKPTVTVTTKNLRDKIQISIKDNGPGIPEEIKDKIFQPFFTTKSTGEGTGLGLSLSYDIITKGHGGELKVVSEEGIGTEFIIQLDLS